MQGPNCGAKGSGSGTGSTKPASTPQDRTAAAMNTMENNLQGTRQIINNAGATILNTLRPDNNSNSGVQPINSVADTSTADSTSATRRGVPSLLDPGLPPSSSTNSAINSLLGDATQPSATATTPASAIASLLDLNKVSDATSAFPAYIPFDPPDDPRFAIAMQGTVDRPDPIASASLSQRLQGMGQQVEDQLSGLVSSSGALASSVLDNRFVQWAMNDKGDFTTVPLAAPSDSPDTAASLVSGQSVVGFGTILKQCVKDGPSGCEKGIEDYGTAMVNQMGAILGYAQVNIMQNPNPDPNN
jgi:hypothetical protein